MTSRRVPASEAAAPFLYHRIKPGPEACLPLSVFPMLEQGLHNHPVWFGFFWRWRAAHSRRVLFTKPRVPPPSFTLCHPLFELVTLDTQTVCGCSSGSLPKHGSSRLPEALKDGRVRYRERHPEGLTPLVLAVASCNRYWHGLVI